MEKRNLNPGDVVQLKPNHEHYAEMLLVVTSPRTFGCQGYLLSWAPFEGVSFKGKSFFKVSWDQMEYVGKLPFFDEEDYKDQ